MTRGDPDQHLLAAVRSVIGTAQAVRAMGEWLADHFDAQRLEREEPLEAAMLQEVAQEIRRLSGVPPLPPEFGVELTASDPEPPVGTRVRDFDGRTWERTEDEPTGAANWELYPDNDGGHESWRKVAGNYGPVRVTRVALRPPGRG